MELRHLRALVAVADELHFGRAAQRLHLTQPSISGQLRQLETELGVRLLTRSAREVALTDAGAGFLEDARRIVAHAESARMRVRAGLDGDRARLRVGYVADALPRALPVALRRLASAACAPHVELVSSEPRVLLSLVRDGSLDAAIVSLPVSTDRVYVIPFAREEAVIAVQAGGGGQRDADVPLGLVSRSTVLSRPRRTNPGFYDGVSAAFSAAGLPVPMREIEGATVEQLLLRVAAGGGMALLPSSVADQLRAPGLHFRRLTGRAPVGCPLAVITRSQEMGPHVAMFAAALTLPEPAREPHLERVPVAA